MGKGNFRLPIENRHPSTDQLCQIRRTYLHGGFWAHEWNITEIIFIYAPFWGNHLQVTHDGWNYVFLRKDVPFGDLFTCLPNLGSNLQTPNFGAWICVFRPNSSSISTKFCTVIKTTKCHSWVVPTHASQIHLRKIEKSLYLGRGLSDFDKIWHDNAVPPSLPFWSSKIPNFKIQDGGGRHLEKLKSQHISAAVGAISTKVGKMTEFDLLGRHLTKSINGHISASVQAILRNFAWWRSSAFLIVPAVKNTKFQKSKMAAAAILKSRKLTYLCHGSSSSTNSSRFLLAVTMSLYLHVSHCHWQAADCALYPLFNCN